MASNKRHHYKESLGTFCAAAWLQTNIGKESGQAMRRAMRDAQLYPVTPDESKLKREKDQDEIVVDERDADRRRPVITKIRNCDA